MLGKRDGGDLAVVGVKAGADLGQIEVKPSKGYAKVKKPPEDAINDGRLARAKNGVPKGAGNFGLVKSKPPKDPPAGDQDFDGIPDPLDVDDDGDLILDDYDRPAHSGASGAASRSAVDERFPDALDTSDEGLDIGTMLLTQLGLGTVNVNGGSSDEQISAAQQLGETLVLLWDPVSIDPDSGELDCGGSPDPGNPDGWIGGLSYCTRGGTGGLAEIGRTPATARAFPECCDSNGNGFGSLSPFGPMEPMTLFPGATLDQMSAGDVLIMRATQDGAPVEFANTVGFIFSTHPALAAYSDGQGNSGTLTYPRPAPCNSNPMSCALPVHAGPSGDVVVTMALWKPQRRRIEGESGQGEWMDVGNLAYGTSAVTFGQGTGAGFCPQSSYSGVDPNLTVLPPDSKQPSLGGAEFADQSGDQPSSPANTLTFTLNLTDCLAAHGQTMSTTESTSVGFSAKAEGANPVLPGGHTGPPYFSTSGAAFILQP